MVLAPRTSLAEVDGMRHLRLVLAIEVRRNQARAVAKFCGLVWSVLAWLRASRRGFCGRRFGRGGGPAARTKRGVVRVESGG